MNVLLIIAEDRAVCEALRVALPKSDLPIFEATLDNASRRLVSLQADAIILDDAPGLGGETIAPIKAVAPGVPLIALSGRGDLVTQAGLTRAGADRVLVKPFSCEVLRDAIDKLAQRQETAPRPAPAQENGYARNAALDQHQMALRWLGRISLYADNPTRLSQSLVEASADIFDAVRSAVVSMRSASVVIRRIGRKV